ncbi:hypothetical protein, partial [Micromonospora parva]|uniref:hypothetical protein n=1 Tax=Micromonospora parva TaxID=1464048 RepID=UPI00365C532E
DDPASAVSVVMGFDVVEGEVELREIYGVEIDLTLWMSHLVENFPPSGWKPFAITEMLRFLSIEEVRQQTTEAPPAPTKRTGEKVQVKHAGGAQGSGGKRHRITDEHLEEVARVYGEALRAGIPPTREVSDVFEVSHSTAAKWVGAARRKGMLPAWTAKD